MILRHSYTRNRDTARAALRYYQLRPRGEDEPTRAIFGPDGTLSRAEAAQLIDAQQPPGGRYLAHRLMLSPGDDERPEDLRAMTYRAMHGLAREKEHNLAWVAVEHRNTDQPHVHILLAGGGERDGTVREVRLGREDHTQLKADAAEYCRMEARIRGDWDRALATAARGLDDLRSPRELIER